VSEVFLRAVTPTMGGWLTPDRAVEMYRLVREYRPALTVEIGVFSGRSLVATAMGLKDNGHGHALGIDAWRPQTCIEGEHHNADARWWARTDLHAVHRACMETIWRLGLAERVTVIRAASQDCAGIIPDGIGILYIDGNHSELASCRDVELYLPKVAPGGYCWMDDTDWISTKKAQSMMGERCELVKDGGNYRLYKKN
jgi:cephalosporin hydroxylase